MKIDISMGTKRDSLALRQFAEHALMRKVGARAERIQRARIRLNDVNGPRGGIDKVCHIRFDVVGAGEVSVRGESAGWYEAVTIAVMNARSALDRRLDRVRGRKARQRRKGDLVDSTAEEAGRLRA